MGKVVIFLSVLNEFKPFVVAIRSNHGVWLLKGRGEVQQVAKGLVFSDGQTEVPTFEKLFLASVESFVVADYHWHRKTTPKFYLVLDDSSSRDKL